MAPPFCPCSAGRGVGVPQAADSLRLFENEPLAWCDGLPYWEMAASVTWCGGRATGIPGTARTAAHAPTGAPRRGTMAPCP